MSFLQPLLGCPQLFVLALVSLPLVVSDVVGWLVLACTGRDPAFHNRWASAYLVSFIRVWAYINLVVGTYPGWRLGEDEMSPARLVIGPPKAKYKRDRAAFRLVYVLPALFRGALAGFVGYGLALASAVLILMTGRQSRRVFQMQCECQRRFALYGLLVNLVTEDDELALL